MTPITYRTVPFSHGWLWIRLAFRMYRRKPLMWIAYATAIVIIGALLTLIPIVGAFVFQLIAPVLNGGMMLACHDERRLQPLQFNRLFSAFSSHGSQLVTVGGIYLTGMLLVFTGPSMMGSDPVIHLLYSGLNTPQALQQLQQLPLTPSAGLVLGLSLLLFIVMLMAYWFAPALVVLGNQRAIDAMKLSFSACAANFPAFFLYGVIMFILLLLATIPAMLGFLIVIPIGFINYYISYKDVFRHR